jgi:hypothetical protein
MLGPGEAWAATTPSQARKKAWSMDWSQEAM